MYTFRCLKNLTFSAMKYLFTLAVCTGIIWISSKIVGCSYTKGVFKPGIITVPGYHVRDHRVYYYGGLMNASVKELANVDAATFKIIRLDSDTPGLVSSSSYARDHKQVYYQGHVITGADPESFTINGSRHPRDKHHVYDRWRPFSDDPEHYRHLKDDLYIDSNHIYWGTVVLSDEPQQLRFTMTTDSSSLTYYADSKGVFASNGMRMPGVDPLTFEPLKGLYSADAKHVYVFDVLELKIVPEADPATPHFSQF